MITIRSMAPLRISFAGGGTDVEPYVSERSGVVLNATISRYAYGSLRQRSDRKVTLNSLDYRVQTEYNLDEDAPADGQLELVKSALARLNHGNLETGFDIFLHTDAPPGSGLGASSSLVVALIALFRDWRNLPLTPYQIAELAYSIERIDFRIKGGRQDQYAATFGGFNFMEFSKNNAIVNSLRISDAALHELQHNLLLCYTGTTRLSANIIDTQVAGYVSRNEDVLSAMDAMKDLTQQMKNALLRGELVNFGGLLHDAWSTKKRFAAQISNSSIDEIYEVARKAGALGGKITGAGGGGHMFFYCPFQKRHLIAEALGKIGCLETKFTFDSLGVRTWRTQ